MPHRAAGSADDTLKQRSAKALHILSGYKQMWSKRRQPLEAYVDGAFRWLMPQPPLLEQKPVWHTNLEAQIDALLDATMWMLPIPRLTRPGPGVQAVTENNLQTVADALRSLGSVLQRDIHWTPDADALDKARGLFVQAVPLCEFLRVADSDAMALAVALWAVDPLHTSMVPIGGFGDRLPVVAMDILTDYGIDTAATLQNVVFQAHGIAYKRFANASYEAIVKCVDVLNPVNVGVPWAIAVNTYSIPEAQCASIMSTLDDAALTARMPCAVLCDALRLAPDTLMFETPQIYFCKKSLDKLILG